MIDPQSHQVALYQDVRDPTWITVYRFWGENDLDYHIGFIRISEPVMVRFHPLKSDEAVRTALGALDAHEHELRLELEEKLAELRERRKNLLALTHYTLANGEFVKEAQE